MEISGEIWIPDVIDGTPVKVGDVIEIEVVVTEVYRSPRTGRKARVVAGRERHQSAGRRQIGECRMLNSTKKRR